jgi:hypothetical protein
LTKNEIGIILFLVKNISKKDLFFIFKIFTKGIIMALKGTALAPKKGSKTSTVKPEIQAAEIKSTTTDTIVEEQLVDVQTAYHLVKAQNDVLLSLIKRYFDFQETAVTQGFEFFNRLLTEGIDLAKTKIESQDAHTEVHLEIQLEETKQRIARETEESERRYELQLNEQEQRKKEKEWEQVKQEFELKSRAAHEQRSADEYAQARKERELDLLEKLLELRAKDPNHEHPELWERSSEESNTSSPIESAANDKFLQIYSWYKDPTQNPSNDIHVKTEDVKKKLADWGFTTNNLTKSGLSETIEKSVKESLVKTETSESAKSVAKAEEKSAGVVAKKRGPKPKAKKSLDDK